MIKSKEEEGVWDTFRENVTPKETLLRILESIPDKDDRELVRYYMRAHDRQEGRVPRV